jgi:hypothetical protein
MMSPLNNCGLNKIVNNPVMRKCTRSGIISLVISLLLLVAIDVIIYSQNKVYRNVRFVLDQTAFADSVKSKNTLLLHVRQTRPVDTFQISCDSLYVYTAIKLHLFAGNGSDSLRKIQTVDLSDTFLKLTNYSTVSLGLQQAVSDSTIKLVAEGKLQ